MERLQQYLPFTVLKQHNSVITGCLTTNWLQQYLPFTVLKHNTIDNIVDAMDESCNSTYRLRY